MKADEMFQELGFIQDESKTRITYFHIDWDKGYVIFKLDEELVDYNSVIECDEAINEKMKELGWLS